MSEALEVSGTGDVLLGAFKEKLSRMIFALHFTVGRLNTRQSSLLASCRQFAPIFPYCR
jgi:hypothetical protein